MKRIPLEASHMSIRIPSITTIFLSLFFCRRPVPNIPPRLPERPIVPGGKPDLSERGFYHNVDNSLL